MIDAVTFEHRVHVTWDVWVEFSFAEASICVGLLIKNTGHGWNALDCDNEFLGTFGTADEAAGALAELSLDVLVQQQGS